MIFFHTKIFLFFFPNSDHIRTICFIDKAKNILLLFLQKEKKNFLNKIIIVSSFDYSSLFSIRSFFSILIDSFEKFRKLSLKIDLCVEKILFIFLNQKTTHHTNHIKPWLSIFLCLVSLVINKKIWFFFPKIFSLSLSLPIVWTSIHSFIHRYNIITGLKGNNNRIIIIIENKQEKPNEEQWIQNHSFLDLYLMCLHYVCGYPDSVRRLFYSIINTRIIENPFFSPKFFFNLKIFLIFISSLSIIKNSILTLVAETSFWWWWWFGFEWNEKKLIYK